MSRKVTREAKIHFELHRHLQNAIEKGVSYKGVTFERSEPEYTKNLIGNQSADIVVFDTKGHPWLVIEAKKRLKKGFTRDIDPYSPKVIQQSLGYAQQLRTPFFATYNGEILVLFKTFEEFKPLLESKSKSYKISDIAVFASSLLQDIVSLHYGDEKWDQLDDSFVKRVKHFHRRLYPRYYESLKIALSKKKKFKKEFIEWAKEQGFDIEKKQLEVEEGFAKQGAYILINQILFYKILENSKAYQRDIEKLKPVFDLKTLPNLLKKNFNDVVQNIDFKAVFEQDEIFNSIEFSDQISDLLNELIDEVRDYDLSVFDSDVIGRIYEELIPSLERHDLGQYYTPPPITQLIIDLCLKDKSQILLDPACGSGGFLVTAYRRLKTLYAKKEKDIKHEKILSQLYGIDINKFPAHLSAINLAIQEISSRTNNVQIEVSDFFDINVGHGRFARRTASITGKEVDEAVPIPNKVDVIVANPPYIRSGKIENKKKIQKHLKRIHVDISQRADIYVFFFTHSLEFLSEKGKIGFITSDKMLDAAYGEALQEFFLNNFELKSIIKFDKQVFDEPLIGTCITILDKNKKSRERDDNLVNLVRIKNKMNVSKIIQLVEKKYTPETILDTDKYRIVTKIQKNLRNETKWNRYLYAPPLYFEYLENKKLTTLDQLCTILRGHTTGANEFFYLKKEDIESYGLDKSLFVPIMKAIAQANYLNFKKEDTEWFVFDIHDFLEKNVLKKPINDLVPSKDLSFSGFVKEILRKKGFHDILEYIEMGEEKKFHERPTCKTRKLWFDLGKLHRPSFIFPDVYWKKTSVPFNADKITIDKQLYVVEPKEGIDELVLGGILNSDLLALLREMHGRTVMGEALNRNQVMVYEANEIPVPDIRKFSKKELKNINAAFKKLLDKSRTASQEEILKLRRKLNEVVLATLGMQDKAEELEKAVEELIAIRVRGGGIRKDVMVGKEEKRIIKLKGAEVISSKIQSLDNFV